MKVLRNTNLWKTVLIVMLLYLLVGCYKRNNPSPIGTFYPDSTVRGVFMEDTFLKYKVVISFSQPVKIKSVGIITDVSVNEEVALLELPVLDHLPGDDYLAGGGNYYAPISWLQANGRIEYTGYKTPADYFWESGLGSLSKILIVIISLYLGYLILMVYLKENEKKQLEFERLEFEKSKKRAQEEKEIIEKEIERRKKIVLDIADYLYKETEKEVNKTLIPTLINELYDIYTGLYSENMDDLINHGNLSDFQDIIDSIKSELNRLKKLALDAQSKGYTDNKSEYDNSEENSNQMTKEKAFKILGIKTTASKDEIKKAYRNLIKKYNTDQRAHLEDHIRQMLEEKMKALNNAKDYLSNLGII